jgi:capsular exopolysaccharide synthesis family protein
MSRVNDAMRHAGQDDDLPEPPSDTVFLSSEDGGEPVGEEERASEEEPAPPSPPAAVQGELISSDGGPLAVVHSRLERIRGEASDDVRLEDIARLLRRWRWLIAGVVSACLAVAVIYNRTTTPVFETVSSVLIEPTAQTTLPVRGGSGEDPARYDYYVTQIEVLRSRALALATLDRLEKMSPRPLTPEQARRTVGSLKVNPRKSELGDSRLVTIHARSTDPAAAALVANVHAETYVDQNLTHLRAKSHEAADWLNAQLAELRRDVSASQGKLQIYREQHDGVSLEEGQNTVVDKLMQLNTLANNANNELLEKQSLHQQILDLETRGAPLDTLPMVQSNGQLQGIKAEIEKLRQERAKLSVDFLDTAQPIKDIDAAIETQQRRLQLETSKSVESFKTEYRAAQRTHQGLLAALKEQDAAVSELSRKAIGYGELQRDAESIQKIFEMVMTRLKETELSGELQTNNIRVLDKAEVPGAPVWPRSTLNLIVALIGGTLLALGLVFSLEFLRPRLLDPQDIAAHLGLPLLGTAPRVSKFRVNPGAPEAVPGAFQEAIRHIRAQIFLSAASPAVRTLAVTSARPGEGKTVMATSLAISIAMSGRRVLLVDGDLRQAQLASIFGIKPVPGLANVIAGDVKPSEALVESPIRGLYVLPAGDERANPGDLLDSVRLTQLIAGLRKVFDVVVIDCPPVTAVADAAIVSSAAASVVFVVSAGHTSRAVAQFAVDRLEAVQARVLGVVLNNASGSVVADHYSPYYRHGRTLGGHA